MWQSRFCGKAPVGQEFLRGHCVKQWNWNQHCTIVLKTSRCWRYALLSCSLALVSSSSLVLCFGMVVYILYYSMVEVYIVCFLLLLLLGLQLRDYLEFHKKLWTFKLCWDWKIMGTFELGLYEFHAMIWPQVFGGEMECGDLLRMASYIGSSVWIFAS